MIVPERPGEFFGQFLPRYLAELASPAGLAPSRTAPGARSGTPAPAGVVVRVVDAGLWTLRIVAGQLQVQEGGAEDAALQISFSVRDFVALVVTPINRAQESAVGTSEAQRAAVQNGFLARLGRWDEETVGLLRRQTGRILVRVEDAGTSRNVALTPGTQPYSLEEAECTIDCRLVDLEQLQAKRASPLDLFYAGQIRIGGDAQIALAMAGLFL